MAALLGRGPAFLPHPRQGCGSHQPLPAAATSHQWPAASGKSTWFSLSPLKPFLPQFIC